MKDQDTVQEEKAPVNSVAQFLRAEVELCERSQQLGVFRRVSHEDAVRIFIRAAEEIEALLRERS